MGPTPKCHFVSGVLKISNLRLLQLWAPITLCANLRLRWGLKQSCSPHRELSNNMLHTTYTQGNHGDSWLLVVRSQITNLTPNPSFGHNVYFLCLNGSCKLILYIYISRVFQKHKELFNPMVLTLAIVLWKFKSPSGLQLPKWELILGVWGFIPSHSPTFSGAWNVTPMLHSWPIPSQTLALIMSPRLRLRHLHF
jgi:hypothetical protein